MRSAAVALQECKKCAKYEILRYKPSRDGGKLSRLIIVDGVICPLGKGRRGILREVTFKIYGIIT